MRKATILLLAAAAMPATAFANTCPAPAAQPLQPTAVVPVANELAPLAVGQLGAPNGVLAQAYDQVLTLDQVLLRLRVDACLALAATTPAGSPGAHPDLRGPHPRAPRPRHRRLHPHRPRAGRRQVNSVICHG